MNVFELFTKSDSVKESRIGKFEAPKDNLSKALLGLFNQMSMLNPGKLTSHATKGVSIIQKADKYIITLNAFKPPIKIEWTATMNASDFEAKLMEIISKRQKIGYINKANLEDGNSVFQIAFA